MGFTKYLEDNIEIYNNAKRIFKDPKNSLDNIQQKPLSVQYQMVNKLYHIVDDLYKELSSVIDLGKELGEQDLESLSIRVMFLEKQLKERELQHRNSIDDLEHEHEVWISRYENVLVILRCERSDDMIPYLVENINNDKYFFDLCDFITDPSNEDQAILAMKFNELNTKIKCLEKQVIDLQNKDKTNEIEQTTILRQDTIS